MVKNVSHSQTFLSEQDSFSSEDFQDSRKTVCNLNHNFTDVLVVSLFSGKLCNSLPEVHKPCSKGPENYTVL